MTGFWAFVKGRVRRFFRPKTRPHPLGVTALEDRVVPASLLAHVLADFTGDGRPDLVVAANGTAIRVFDGADGTPARTLSFDGSFAGPVSLAAADFTGDGRPELVVAAGAGGGPRVRAFDLAGGSVVRDFFAYEPSFRGGVRVAVGDLTGDGRPDFALGAGPGGGPRARVLDGVSGATVADEFVYEESFRGGINVAAGDRDGDGRAELVTGAGPGGGPRVRVFEGRLDASVRDFFAADGARRDGVGVAAGDLDGNGLDEVVVTTFGRLQIFGGSNPDPYFQRASPDARSVGVGDLDGDGFGELLLGGESAIDAFGGADLAARGTLWTVGSAGPIVAAPPAPPAPAFSGGAIRTPGPAGGPATVRLSLRRAYAATAIDVGLFPVDDALGRIGTLAPGDAGYLAAALGAGRSIAALAAGTTSATLTLPAGAFFGLSATTAAGSFISFAAANPGGATQFRLLPGNRFALEDAPSGGFGEFHAVIADVSVADGTTPPPPPPSGTFAPDLAGWSVTDLGGSTGGTTVSDGVARLTEGDRFRVGLSQAFVVPATPTAVTVTFDEPAFDTASTGRVRDAFEVAVLAADGRPLALPAADGRDAAFNVTEGLAPALGETTSIATGRVTIDLAGLPAGTPAQLVLRLVNNDSDTGTSVVVRRVDYVASTAVAVSGRSPAAAPQARGRVDVARLDDVTPAVRPSYGRTTLTEDRTILAADLALTNAGTYPLIGTIAVAVGNLSDPAVRVIGADGVLPDGRSYFNFTPEMGPTLAPGGTTAPRPVTFSNPNRERFTYDLAVLAGVNRAPTLDAIATALVPAGGTFAARATAMDPDAQTLSFSLLGGPPGLTIDAATGAMAWSPTAADLGNHAVRVRVSDPLGATDETTGTVTVRDDLPNRPPEFTSSPPTDATVTRPFEVLTYATGANPVAAAAGDFGLATANEGDQMLGVIGGPSRSLGEPHPSEYPTPFVTGVNVPLGLVPNTELNSERDIQGVLAADVNGDGNPDAIVMATLNIAGDYIVPGETGHVTVRLGNGDGTFRDGFHAQFPTVASRSGRGVTLRYADVTGDGRKDLVVTRLVAKQTLVYAGTAAGLFDTAPIVTANDAPFVNAMQLADLNGDGTLDLVHFEGGHPQVGTRHGFSVQLGHGDGTFAANVFYAQSATNQESGYLVDADGDGDPDAVRVNYNNVRLETYLNDGSGIFGPVIESKATAYGDAFGGNFGGGFPGNVQTGAFSDFDGDGKTDALLSGPYYQVLLKGQGNGAFGDGTPAGNVSVVTPIASGRSPPRWPNLLDTDGSPFDLNADGHADMIYGDASDSSMLLTVLGTGDGTFTAQGYTPFFDDDIGTGTVRGAGLGYYAAVADFNRDGVTDVLASRQQSVQRPGSVGLILGDAPGTFRAPVHNTRYDTAHSGKYHSFAGDFDGDGLQDNVTLGYVGFNFALYFAKGRGDGTFDTPFAASGVVNNNVDSPIVADVDRDGKLDIAMIDGGNFRVFLGLGNGAFGNLPNVNLEGGGPAGVSEQCLQQFDINADGHPDFVARLQTGNIDTNFATAIRVMVYDPAAGRYDLLPDAGNLYSSLPRTGGYYFDESLGAGDLDGDGKREFFAFSRDNPNLELPSKWIVWEQTGTSGGDAADYFTRTIIESPNFIAKDASPHSIVVRDFDGDGTADMAYSTHGGTTVVVRGNGDFTFRDPVTYVTNNQHLQAGDFNGDGFTDLATTWSGFISYSQRPTSGILFGRGDGNFDQHLPYEYATGGSYGTGGADPEAVDLDGDGRDDLLAVGSGSHTEAWMARPQGLTATVAGDVNGDGHDDSVSVSADFDRVKILLGDGAGGFVRQNDLISGRFPVAVKLADVDGDGDPDIVTANKLGKSVSIFTNDAGKFSRQDAALDHAPIGLALGDINGDAKADIAAASDALTAIINGTATVIALGFTASDVTLADVTGDGATDAVVADGTNARLMILPGDGRGGFAPPTVVPVAVAPEKIAAADLNADGRADLIVTLPGGGAVAILFGRGAGRFATPQRVTLRSTPTSLAVADVNADGRPDLLVSHGGDDTLSVVVNRYDPATLVRYVPTATDPDGDAVTFDLAAAPGGMLLDDATGTILWAPMPDQVGPNAVVVRASDGRGGEAEQGFPIAVAAPGTVPPPAFTSEPVEAARADREYVYAPRTANAENARFTLANGPAGMTIDATTGELRYDPARRGWTLWRTLYGSYVNAGQILAADAPSLRPASVTAEGWFRLERAPGSIYTQLLGKRLSASNVNLVSFGIENYFGTLRASAGGAVIPSPLPIRYGEWTHLALTFDDATKTLTFFVDGVAIGTAVGTEGLRYSTESLMIDTGNSFVGSVAGVRIWDEARPAADVRAGMFRDAASPRLVLDWRFREGDVAATVVDSSGFANHGTLRNAPDLVGYPVHVASPGVAGEYPVTIRVDNGRGGVAEQRFTLRVTSPVPTAVTGRVLDATDAGVPGRTVYADDNRNGRFDVGEPSAVTNPDGTYSLAATGGVLSVALLGEPGTVQAEPAGPDRTVDLAGPAGGVGFRVRPAVGDGPEFLTVPPSAVAVPGSYDYRAFAVDPAGGPVTYAFALAPDGMAVDASTGRVVWTPRATDGGEATAILKATGASGRVALQTIRVGVAVPPAPLPPRPNAPRFVGVPPTEARVGATYVYPVAVSNPSGGPLTFSLPRAPAGMVVDAAGAIAWTPVAVQTASVIVRVADGLGNFATQSFRVAVTAGSANRAPVATSVPPSDATVGDAFPYAFAAIDPESSTVTYSVVRGPAGLTIDANAGVVTWTPAAAEVGTVNVTLRATDPLGAAAVQSFAIDVRASNAVPVIAGTAPTRVSQGALYRYDLAATDADAEPLSYDLLAGPAGATVDARGRVRWQTELSTPLGDRSFSVRVSDGRGATATQNFTLTVGPDRVAPRAVILVGGEPVLYPWTTRPAVVRVSATDDVGVAGITLFVDDVPTPLNADGTANVVFTAPGLGRLRAVVTDAAGNTGTATGRVNMRSGEEDGSGNPAPAAAITSVADGDDLRGFVTVNGTANAPDLARYTLSYRRGDSGTSHVIATGTTGVTDGPLGTWDTTLLENDVYVLRLEVTDAFGSFAAVEREVGVCGEFKLGNFRLSFADMTVPVAGIPITVARTYDTLRADRRGDFGFGWRMEYRNTDLRTSLPASGLEDLGIHTPFRIGTKVYVTLPGGAREGFTFDPALRVLPGTDGANLIVAAPRFRPDRGVFSTLRAGDGTLIVNDAGELYAAGNVPWNPASPDFADYTLTTADGLTYGIDAATGNLVTATDRGGAIVTFTDAGIFADGVSVTFERDAAGRLTRALDPSGAAIAYAYDSRGDLTSVTDRVGNVTRYWYRVSPAHYLEAVIDPLGREGIRAAYGPDGRLTQTVGADGATVTIDYDPAHSLVTTTDPLGHATVTEFDARGNPVAVTNALGETTRRTFDAADNETSVTDPLGHVTSATYDGAGRKTSTTDALGATTVTTYDGFGAILGRVSPGGAAVTLGYDASNRLTRATNALGASVAMSHSGGGLSTLTTDDGHSLRFAGSGDRPTSATSSNGTAASYAYTPTNRLDRMTLNGTAEYRYGYDANDRVVSVTDPVGAVTAEQFDAAGNRIAAIDPLGRVTAYAYDSRNRLVATTWPDGTTDAVRYDRAGRVIAETDRAGRVTTYEYDAAGRRTAVIGPDSTPETEADNPRRRYQYDAAGRLVAEIDERGAARRYRYDAAGRLTHETDPLGATVVTAYTVEGFIASRTDALGRVTRFESDADGHVTAVTHPDGARETRTYSGRGELLSESDATGRTTNYEYDGFGLLTAVVDPLGQRTTYAYNASGQLASSTDPLRRTTRYGRDLAGRLLTRTLPSGEAESYTYDPAGNKLSATGFDGLTTTYTYDAMDRVISESHADGTVILTTYTADGLPETISLGAAVTRFEYDARSRQTARIDPFGTAVRSTYDAAGNRVAMEFPAGTVGYAYDPAGHLTAVTAPDGATTHYTYNAAGELLRTQFPNGTSQTLTRSPRGRVATSESTGPGGVLDRFAYDYDGAGRLLRVTELDGHTVSFQYDAAGRLTVETTTPAGGAARTVNYLYDSAGNRTERTDSLRGTTTYGYDRRDRLLTETTGGTTATSSYDARGNLISRSTGTGETAHYAWDRLGRMTSATTTGPGGPRTANYTYTPDGERATRVDENGTTRFVVDTAREYAQTVAEIDAGGSVSVASIRPANGLGLVAEIRNGRPSFVHAGTAQSVHLLTDAAGTATDRIRYAAFGEIAARTGVTPLTSLFHGEPRDSLTGFDYLRARHYNPFAGQFVSMDSFAGFLADPLSQNKYVFAHQNPVTGLDPSGHYTLTEAQMVLAVNTAVLTIGGAVLGGAVAKHYHYEPLTGMLVGAFLGGLLGVGAAIATVHLVTSTGGAVLITSQGTYMPLLMADVVAGVGLLFSIYGGLIAMDAVGLIGTIQSIQERHGGGDNANVPFSSLNYQAMQQSEP